MPNVMDPPWGPGSPKSNLHNKPERPSSPPSRHYLRTGIFHFLLLPREIRDTVYRHLLEDAADGIQPQYKGCMRGGGKCLYIDILLLCHQIHKEALLVLYNENLYRYHTRSTCKHYQRGFGIQMSDQTFNRIQKVQIAITPIHCCPFIPDCVTIIAYVRNLGATLKTLHLDFYQVRAVANNDEYEDFLEIAISKRVAAIASTIVVQNTVTITMSGHDEDIVDKFRVLTDLITNAKGWKIVTNRKEYDVDQGHLAAIPYQRSWQIRPLNATADDDSISKT